MKQALIVFSVVAMAAAANYGISGSYRRFSQETINVYQICNCKWAMRDYGRTTQPGLITG